jgi:type II secretory pathway component PulM
MVAGYLVVLVVLAIVFALITGPLRSVRHARSNAGDELAELHAARDSKYQEIRDAEMDLRTGKLSDEDYQAIDQTLRGEAIDILRRLDAAEADEARDADDEDEAAGAGVHDQVGDREPHGSQSDRAPTSLPSAP